MISLPSRPSPSLPSLSLSLVPPLIVPQDNDRHIVKVEGENANLTFAIENDAPPVTLDNIQWYYSRTFSSTPENAELITDLETRLGHSLYMYTTDKLQLTISNVNHSDDGRYFIVVSNPAGIDYNYIDLLIHGELILCSEAL